MTVSRHNSAACDDGQTERNIVMRRPHVLHSHICVNFRNFDVIYFLYTRPHKFEALATIVFEKRLSYPALTKPILSVFVRFYLQTKTFE